MSRTGCEEDMRAEIEAQIERFAPGFRDCILDAHTMGPGDYERYNPNLVGGRHRGRGAGLAAAGGASGAPGEPVYHAGEGYFSLFGIDAARGGGAWDVRVPRRAGGAFAGVEVRRAREGENRCRRKLPNFWDQVRVRLERGP